MQSQACRHAFYTEEHIFLAIAKGRRRQMVQAVKSLATKAVQIASVAPSTLPRFPPKEASVDPQNPQAYFSPETWASLQKPPDTAYTAFVHRIGLGKIITAVEDIHQACTHTSFPTFYSTHYPNEKRLSSNANLSTLGNALLGLFATEYLHASYPYLPTRVLKVAVSAYVGPGTCATVAKEMGATPLVRWYRPENTLHITPPVTLADALSTVPRALTALVYQRRSLPVARKFAHSFFLNREVDLRSFIKFRDPKLALSRTVDKFQRERPISRILKETGRMSNSPIFVVGVFSGVDKLGEGFGSSLRMAEYRAAEDALHRLYLTRVPPENVNLPTATFREGLGSVFELSENEDEHVPGDIGELEVIYASKNR